MTKQSFKQWLKDGFKHLIKPHKIAWCALLSSITLAVGITFTVNGFYLAALLLIPGVLLFLYTIYLISGE